MMQIWQALQVRLRPAKIWFRRLTRCGVEVIREAINTDGSCEEMR